VNDEELRALGPDGLARDRKAALRADLLARIAADAVDDAPAASTVTAEGAPLAGGEGLAPEEAATRSWTWIAAAAAVVVLLGLGALIASTGGDDGPVPSDDEQAWATTLPLDQLPIDDGRVLAASRVTCIGAEGVSGTYVADATSTGAGDAIDEDDLLRACREAGRETGGNQTAPPTFCVDSASGRRQPVALLVVRSCEDAGLTPISPADLAAIERDRRTELLLVELRDECSTAAAAADEVGRDLRASGTDLDLQVEEGDAEACHRVVVRWEDGIVAVEPAAER
jgi:hypothetical protein